MISLEFIALEVPYSFSVFFDRVIKADPVLEKCFKTISECKYAKDDLL